MPPSLPSVRTEGDHVVVEAPTAESALELVAERLGTRAKIENVERVRRGGVGGFFARELVQVTATGESAPAAGRTGRAQAGDALAQARTSQPADAGASPVDRLLRELSERDDPFAAVLQRKLDPEAAPAGGDTPPPASAAAPPASGHASGAAPPASGPASAAPPAPAAAGAPATPSAPSAPWPTAAARPPYPLAPPIAPPVAVPNGEPTVPGAAAPLPGTPQWSIRNLFRLGLPPLLSPSDAAALSPQDDIRWTHALAGSLQPLCRPLPSVSTIVVGPAAERLAGVLELPIRWPGQQVPRESFVAPISGRASDREWLASVRGTRQLHLVVGGPGWRGLLFDDPVALSHDDTSMCEAVTLAYQLGLGLAYTCDMSGAVSRTNPMDLALAIRRLLPTNR